MKIDQFQDEFRFLSNFYDAPVTGDDGIWYPTTEHMYQAYKTLDLSERRRIAGLQGPDAAKKAGRHIEVLRPDWESVKEEVMLQALEKKFAPGSVLAEMLLTTGELPLEEGNWWKDTYWGVDLKTGEGKNRLGKLLMKVRKELKK